jgi:hypothetical protein
MHRVGSLWIDAQRPVAMDARIGRRDGLGIDVAYLISNGSKDQVSVG